MKKRDRGRFESESNGDRVKKGSERASVMDRVRGQRRKRDI